MAMKYTDRGAVAELPKSELVDKVVSLTRSLQKKGESAVRGEEHSTRALARKAGGVAGIAEVAGAEFLLGHKPWLKYVEGGLSLAGFITGGFADYYDAEGLANFADGMAIANGAAAATKFVPHRTTSGHEGAQGTGEMWESGLVEGPGPRPTERGPGRTQAPVINTSQAAPVAARRANLPDAPPPRPRFRPLRALARGARRLFGGARRALAAHGYEDSEANVDAILEAGDVVLGEYFGVDPVSGEFVDLVTAGDTAGPISQLRNALKALRDLGPLMSALASVQQNAVPAAPTQGEPLSDDELSLASVMGILDAEDSLHVVASGLDDGLYLSASGEDLTPDQVRAQIDECCQDTGAISDRWNAFLQRRDTKKQARQERLNRRLESKQRRTELKAEKKAIKQERRLTKKEAKAERNVAYAQNRLDAQQASDARRLESIEQQGEMAQADTVENAPAEPEQVEATQASDESWEEGGDWDGWS